jgi:hypothetical protein
MNTEEIENVEKNNCIICLEEMNSDIVIFPCQHSLHTSCFNSYAQHKLQQGQTSIMCPLCQKEIMHIHPINVISTQPNIPPMPIRNRGRFQSVCFTVCNIVMTLGVSALLYYTIDTTSSKP